MEILLSKYAEKRFEIIYKKYKLLRKKNPDLQMEFCIQQKNLQNAIKIAAKSIDQNGKIHNHQRRIGAFVLNLFATELLQYENDIEKVNNFDSLYNIIKTINFTNIGNLTVYDVATRIGAYMNIFPDKIYLHAGAKVGAKNLLGNIKGKQFLKMSDLPNGFLKYDITAYEFEDIFCIFRDELKELNITKR